jgi:hypothetical protein
MQIFTVQEAVSFFVQNYDDNPMQSGKVAKWQSGKVAKGQVKAEMVA